MKKWVAVLTAFLWVAGFAYPQRAEKVILSSVGDYFSSYQTSYTTPTDRCRVEQVKVDTKGRTVEIYLNENFAGQSFTSQKVESIYAHVRELLPKSYASYSLRLYGKGVLLEHLVTDIDLDSPTLPKKWGKALYKGAPWVERLEKPYTTSLGMANRHVSVWASHGRYYKNDKQEWTWQRPYLYCTTEDLFTQTIVVPFLIPMLENAGAIVFTPRERDWQPNEAVVDNDTPLACGTYSEKQGRHGWEEGGTGFARLKDVYLNGDNPFADGSFRRCEAVNKKSLASAIRWTPQLPEPGRYAVYVSYATLPTSVPDAHYVVRHKGVSTSFRVNQRMGGGTWTYLGTFEFDTDDPENNFVGLDNMSNHRGTVTADAVRFGGGMGNIARGDSLQETTSGMPRFLEGARYNAQWSGMPPTVYNGKNGINDYGDDINVRSHMTNYLASGSSYVPADSGLHVPIELSIAVHSDAGIAPFPELIGTLGIYTTGVNEGLLAGGLSRFTSRDLCDIVVSQVDSDMRTLFGRWKRRQIFDRNYSETREPQVPSMIIEMLSHQNFRDMALGHDPVFKFHLARAIYKGALKYTSYQRGVGYAVQPLPVTGFQTSIHPQRHEIELSWQPVADPLEPTASPTGYVVYTRRGNRGYDNGTYVRSTRLTVQAEENEVYTFKVCAVNDGGLSFPSEELAAMIARHSKAKVLIVDGFQRLAAPQVICNDSLQGFDMDSDPGVPFMRTPGYSGKQTVFNTLTHPKSLWGASGNELEGRLMAGNTFDHSHSHGEAIATIPGVSFASASRSAVESQAVDLNEYHVVDLILGLQKDDGYSTRSYPTLTPALCEVLREYTRMRGNLLVSGAYVARDQKQKEGLDFLRNTLKVDAYAPVVLSRYAQVGGMNTTLHLYNELNERHYAVTHADCLVPLPEAFSTLLYLPMNYSAAVAYPGTDYRAVTLGFPFECIKYDADRDKIMRAFLEFLLQK